MNLHGLSDANRFAIGFGKLTACRIGHFIK